MRDNEARAPLPETAWPRRSGAPNRIPKPTAEKAPLTPPKPTPLAPAGLAPRDCTSALLLDRLVLACDLARRTGWCIPTETLVSRLAYYMYT